MKQIREFKSGDIVSHFKRQWYNQGNQYLYKIIGIGQQTETAEKYMVYQALYDDHKIYLRPLDMFNSLTDKEKYPDAKQIYRFEIYKGNSIVEE